MFKSIDFSVDSPAATSYMLKTLAGAAAGNAGADVGGVTQPGRACRGDRIVKGLDHGCGEESQTGYLYLAFIDANQWRAIPVSIAMA